MSKINHLVPVMLGGVMRPKVLILAAAGLFAAMAAQACPACGDKLSLVGGGVSF